MRNIYALVMAVLLCCAACQGGENQQATIERLEQEVASEPTAENRQALVEAYQSYIDTHPDDAERTPQYLQKLAQLQLALQRYSDALTALKKALLNYYNSPATPENALLLADIYTNNLRNEAASTTAYQAFLVAFPNAEQVPDVQQRLSDTVSPLAQRITNLYRGVFDTTTQQLNYTVANDFIYMSEVHAMVLPKDEKSPTLLQEAAELAGAIKAYPKALELYEWIIEHYPNSDKAAQSLFLMAFMYENELQQLDSARTYYEKFLQQYPNHEFADDATVMLKNLGKTPEEILQQMEQPEN